MKTLTVPKIKAESGITLQKASDLIEKQGTLQLIDSLNWAAYPYRPEVKFRIAHTGSEVWLKYYVQEKYIRALETQTNGDVYKDSTVEFFISTDGKYYYNFEFSCIGTRHLAYGPGRENRVRILPQIVESIEVHSSLGTLPFEEKTGGFEWEMMIRIPIKCFVFNKIESFDGLKATANFYKCGDETSEPHYISWNPIKTENPDYHQPEFFGQLLFMD